MIPQEECTNVNDVKLFLSDDLDTDTLDGTLPGIKGKFT